MFEADDNDAVLLIDASNAFNSLNKSAALHNIRILCPTLATFAINTYREPARPFITGGKEIKSAEGTTQGDPIAMGLYAVSLQPLITHLNLFSSARQCWFADDASAAGTLEELKMWWDELFTDVVVVSFEHRTQEGSSGKPLMVRYYGDRCILYTISWSW